MLRLGQENLLHEFVFVLGQNPCWRLGVQEQLGGFLYVFSGDGRAPVDFGCQMCRSQQLYHVPTENNKV